MDGAPDISHQTANGMPGKRTKQSDRNNLGAFHTLVLTTAIPKQFGSWLKAVIRIPATWISPPQHLVTQRLIPTDRYRWINRCHRGQELNSG